MDHRCLRNQRTSNVVGGTIILAVVRRTSGPTAGEEATKTRGMETIAEEQEEKAV